MERNRGGSCWPVVKINKGDWPSLPCENSSRGKSWMDRLPSPKSRFSFGPAEHLNSCPSAGRSRNVLHSPTAPDGPQSSATSQASGRWPSTPRTSCPQPLLSLTGPPQATTGQQFISSQDRHPSAIFSLCLAQQGSLPGPSGTMIQVPLRTAVPSRARGWLQPF